jgi:hypothetical protein
MMILAGVGGTDSVTFVTSAVLAFAAITTSITPIVLARRRSTKEATQEAKAKLDEAQKEASNRAELTLGSWTALNGALQMEITRLQSVIDRQQAVIERCQARVEVLEALVRPGKDA